MSPPLFRLSRLLPHNLFDLARWLRARGTRGGAVFQSKSAALRRRPGRRDRVRPGRLITLEERAGPTMLSFLGALGSVAVAFPPPFGYIRTDERGDRRLASSIHPASLD
jgi:hypothetical protein